MEYWVLAYYQLVVIEDPHAEVAKHQEFFRTRDLKSRIYISEQGINGQMSGGIPHAQEYMEWLKADPRFATISFKIHPHPEHAFPKATIKYRKQLVAIDCEVDLGQRGEHVSSEQWKEMLEERDEDTVVLDVRNDYEWKVGHFEGSELPPLETFRQFPKYAKELKEKRDPKKTKVMMYCTGGIRCEFYSAVMKSEGFEQVYQLDGGVIQYGLDKGQECWKGKLFVFDDRLVVPISKEEAPPIDACRYCQKPHDIYYNCANMDCNELFVCCSDCLKEHRGCCCEGCLNGRVRPIREDANPKPFRKMRPGNFCPAADNFAG
ncbi:MAG: rhodanese-related sulfurtransferase [Verrucomicrobiota bacterium]|nr:rhodanese-related sulfurtransferase [Verrucomicrobiota bacterium]